MKHTPLGAASFHGQIKVVAMLIECGADVNNGNMSPMDPALALASGSLSTISSRGSPPVYLAAKNGQCEAARQSTSLIGLGGCGRGRGGAGGGGGGGKAGSSLRLPEVVRQRVASFLARDVAASCEFQLGP